ncbi:conserved hypothetical protein [Ricinus communis]|uniref:Uncharacterized protein n=1 Tax=Ricinus communis TaxID=3988 RepID=B9TD81_RICCO|nr:conserved hypothetical protein [Ricinus communis]
MVNILLTMEKEIEDLKIIASPLRLQQSLPQKPGSPPSITLVTSGRYVPRTVRLPILEEDSSVRPKDWRTGLYKLESSELL